MPTASGLMVSKRGIDTRPETVAATYTSAPRSRWRARRSTFGGAGVWVCVGVAVAVPVSVSVSAAVWLPVSLVVEGQPASPPVSETAAVWRSRRRDTVWWKSAIANP
jgi:hypothetical protein